MLHTIINTDKEILTKAIAHLEEATFHIDVVHNFVDNFLYDMDEKVLVTWSKEKIFDVLKAMGDYHLDDGFTAMQYAFFDYASDLIEDCLVYQGE